MPFDTSMYQNFQGGTGLAALGQGIRSGLDLVNAKKQQEMQARQQSLQEEAAKRQQAGFETDQAAKMADIRDKVGSHLGEWGGQFLSLKDPAQQQAAWDEKRAELKAQNIPEQLLPKSAQEARNMVGFYNTKYQQALKAAQLDQDAKTSLIAKNRAEAAKLYAEAHAGGHGAKAPEGYRFTANGSLEPIPGGPAAGKVEKQEQMQKQQAGLVVQDLGRAMNVLKDSDWAAGPVAGNFSFVPGSKAWGLNQMLDSVKANVGFDKLQAMRAASPTGGALGAISDKETAMLQATAGKLDVRMPKEVLEDNLRRLANQYNDIVHGPGNGPERFPLSFDENGNPVAKSEDGSVLGINKANAAEATKPPVLKTNQIKWKR